LEKCIGSFEKCRHAASAFGQVSQYLERSEDISRYLLIRAKWLGDYRPASMLVVVPGLVRPEFLIEIEAYGASA